MDVEAQVCSAPLNDGECPHASYGVGRQESVLKTCMAAVMLHYWGGALWLQAK